MNSIEIPEESTRSIYPAYTREDLHAQLDEEIDSALNKGYKISDLCAEVRDRFSQ